MTRIDSVRAAAGSARKSARHAAEAVTPYAETARDAAAHYAHEAGARLGPRASSAARQARDSAREGFEAHISPRLAHARDSLPPEVDRAATDAARRTRKAARTASRYASDAAEYARPHIEQARSAAEPVRAEAAQRGAAAVAALRGEVTPREIDGVRRRRARCARRNKAMKRLGLLGLVAGGAYAVWRWWDRQANPEWLVEPPPATEAPEGYEGSPTAVNGSGPGSASAPSTRQPGGAGAESGAERRPES
ncbi:transcriptional regulator [Streptomyces sp. AJS327]|uniref:DUF5324 family protein n=1 Tax=Streptomyces sp. AJS327 TaxID=2545265 RepID=UPI0015DF33F5|nr:DUF5324 family protein [Streptomyces sp. AJS327]MBA0052946.1 transcriptional regulator [Streptomyces sp. AJS327]